MNNFNLISLQTKCPVCNKSLMDKEHKIDNEPSINLIIETPGKSGIIRLSSIYGSFNYNCEMDLEPGVVAVFSCPHCKAKINTQELCYTCRAPMSSVLLEIGGKINFCSRNGCKNHNISFEDLSAALAKLQLEFGVQARFHTDEVANSKITSKTKTQEEKRKEIIESGSYLQTYCPHCNKSLIEDDMLKIKIVRKEGESGYVLLSPYLNVFSSKSTIFLPEDQTVGDIRCFHCDKSLMIADSSCERCGTQIAKILVSARTKMIDFYICAKKGCTWHGLSKEDLDEIRLEDSLEW
jgi:hypothetical protein